jgi:hypothetical protein
MKKFFLYVAICTFVVVSLSSFVFRESTRFVSETESFEFFPSELNEIFKPGNCKGREIHSIVKHALDNYIFESSAYKDYEEFKDKRVIEAVFSVYENESYRFVEASQGMTEEYRIRIFDDKKTEVFSILTKSSNAMSLEFVAPRSGDYKVQYIFTAKEAKNPKGKCVAFALGYLK